MGGPQPAVMIVIKEKKQFKKTQGTRSKNFTAFANLKRGWSISTLDLLLEEIGRGYKADGIPCREGTDWLASIPDSRMA